MPSSRDSWVALAASALALLELQLGPADGGPSAWSGVVVLASTVPLAWRAKAPVPAALVSCAAFALASLVLPAAEVLVVGIVVFLVWPYTVARRSRTWASAALAGATIVGLVALQGAWDERYGTLGAALANAVYALLGWGVGAGVRTVERRSRRQVEQARAEASESVRQQRAEMARDLHDVVAHALSVVAVQAGGARRVIDTDPRLAATALEDIQAVSRRALVDMRHLLDLLRDSSAPTEQAVRRPGLDGLDELAEPLRRAGLRVDIVHEGSAAPLSPGTETTAVRIVQEALTNVLRHSGARSACMSVRWGPGGLQLVVTDDGVGTRGGGAGHGLVGMRERVDLLAGTLDVGPGEHGGWQVRAWLPLASVPETR